MMTGNEVKKLLNDTDEFLEAKSKDVIDEETKKELALSLALRIVEFEKSCIKIGLDNCITYKAEEVADLLINDPDSFLGWLEKKKFDFVAELRHKDSEQVVEKTAKKNDFEYY